MKEIFKEQWNTCDGGLVSHIQVRGSGRRSVLMPYHTKGMITERFVPGIARRGRLDRGFAKELLAATREPDAVEATEQDTALSGLVNQLLHTDRSCRWNLLPYEPAIPRSLISDEARLISANAISAAAHKTIHVARVPFGDTFHDGVAPGDAIIGIKATVPARATSLVTGSLACGMVAYDYLPPIAMA